MNHVNQKYLNERISADCNVAEDVVKRVLESYQDVVLRALIAGESIRTSNFMTIRTADMPTYNARNPQTGAAVVVPAQRNVKVTVSPRVLELVRAGITEVDGQLVTTRKLPKGAKGVIPVVTVDPNRKLPRVRTVKPKRKPRVTRSPR